MLNKASLATAVVVTLILVSARAATADDDVVSIDMYTTAAQIRGCVSSLAPFCIVSTPVTSQGSNFPAFTFQRSGGGGNVNASASDCLLVWKSCEFNPQNIAQKKTIVAPAQVLTKLDSTLNELNNKITEKYDRMLKDQDERFLAMMRALGLTSTSTPPSAPTNAVKAKSK